MTLLTLHAKIYERTGGRVGHRLLGVPCLLLHTTGRKSGLPRTSSLLYTKDGGSYLVVASNGGSDKAPNWLYNVRAAPAVEMQVKTVSRPAAARIVESGDPDYERLWNLINANNHDRFKGYQAKTARKIPLVVLTPNTEPT